MKDTRDDSNGRAASKAEPVASPRGNSGATGSSLGKWAVLLVIAAAGVLALFVWKSRSSDDQLIDRIHAAYKAGEYQQVLEATEILVIM